MTLELLALEDVREPEEHFCPECGEQARHQPPSEWTEANGPRPDFSHLDGEPLCPIPGRDGSGPALPVVL